MNNDEQLMWRAGITFSLAFIVGVGLSGYRIGLEVGMERQWGEAVKRGVAHHNPQTGKLEWLVPIKGGRDETVTEGD